MKTFVILISLISLISCYQSTKTVVKTNIIEKKKTRRILNYDYNVALKFINEYTENCNNQIGDKSNLWNRDLWIQNNKLLSKDFKSKYKSIIETAKKYDPELGLDFDPIFDAQDFPDIGFEIYEIDSINQLVKVKGIDWKFKLTLKVISKNNTTFVDGVGVINMPKSTNRKE